MDDDTRGKFIEVHQSTKNEPDGAIFPRGDSKLWIPCLQTNHENGDSPYVLVVSKPNHKLFVDHLTVQYNQEIIKEKVMSGDSPERKRPNILVTGTPGVGKTSTASLIAVRVVMKNNCTVWSNAQTSLLIFSDAMLFCRNALD
jgi:hypothetical protein